MNKFMEVTSFLNLTLSECVCVSLSLCLSLSVCVGLFVCFSECSGMCVHFLLVSESFRYFTATFHSRSLFKLCHSDGPMD